MLIRSRRYTMMRIEWEVPAGKIEKGEEPEQAAKRECMEESGCTLKNLEYLFCHYPANGALDTNVYVYRAKVDAPDCEVPRGPVFTEPGKRQEHSCNS